MKPSKKGDYVKISGVVYPVTGKRQQENAAELLRIAGRRTAPIEHWDGQRWSTTGTILHAATKK